MSKFDTTFPIVHSPERIPWNSKSPLIPIIPGNANTYWGKPGDFVDYDGFVQKNDGGVYIYADVGKSFFAEVEPMSFEGGRSAANVRLRDANRPDYTYMFSAYDYITELMVSNLPFGKIRAEWKFTKRGANYRIALINHIS